MNRRLLVTVTHHPGADFCDGRPLYEQWSAEAHQERRTGVRVFVGRGSGVTPASAVAAATGHSRMNPPWERHWPTPHHGTASFWTEKL